MNFLIKAFLFLRGFPTMFGMWIRREEPHFTIGSFKLTDEEQAEFEEDPDAFIRKHIATQEPVEGGKE